MMSLNHRFIWPTFVGCVSLLIIGLVFPQASDAAVYKWRDENGKLHFTDQPHKIPKKYQQKYNKPVYGSIPQKTQSSSTTGSAASKSEGPGNFRAFDSHGRSISINVNDKTAVFAMATWCPYSKKLARFLSNPSVARKMQGLDLIFVFKDEWPYIKKWIDKSVRRGQISQRQAEDRLQRYKEKSKGKIVYDTAFLRELPGKYYFATPATTKLNKIFPSGVPNVYSPKQEKFNQGVTRWLRTQFSNDEVTQNYLVAEFKQYNKGKK